MSRAGAIDSLVLGMAVAVLALPTLALADVLEVSPSGPVWIAGGPASSVVHGPATVDGVAAAGASGSSPSVAAPVTQTAIIDAHVTAAPDSAGPEAWRGRVAELAAKYDISPALLEALVWQESRWRTGAISTAGARGLAQLMPGTARQLGVNPDNPSANLEGGARYLRQQLDTFGGDIEKALAAYNAGPGRVQRAGGIPQIRETQDYVAAILARLSAPVRR